ncbi:S1/P1 nuclease [Gymnopilus junonius]|uniref:S1/P1 nuclease n=1 Tax=Gymnopilus junonius TaxID=109634 RepID=A0A9P5TUG9_GYMJU|nr:S1/P1 nuclease [Gymnopilus junonius]
MKFATIALALSFSTSGVYGWGEDTHMTIGYLAMEFLAPEALSFVKSSLGSTYDESLGPAAPWADDVRSEKAYSWSASFHFVDANDNPPQSCSVSESRDCSAGTCILTAIANYTTRVVDTSLSDTQRQEALKFLGFFLGDIGQPLHVEALEVGGNDIDAKCGGSSTNLHAVNTGMPEKILAANYSSDVQTWASALATRIKTGEYKSLAADWISCSSTITPLNQRRSIEDDVKDLLQDFTAKVTPLQCPLVWAQEANAFDCSYVFSFQTASNPKEDLCTSNYFTGAVPIIEEQVAKQGYRLAAWLNVLFDGATNLP